MECEKCGGPIWDNREDKRNPNSPDFKCKDKECGHAKWLTKKDDPSRNKTTTKKITFQTQSNDREKYWSEKATRDITETLVLRRQSAQEKALRFMLVLSPDGGQKELLAELKKLTDHFLADAMSAAALEPKPEELVSELEDTEPPVDTEDSMEI